MKKSAGVAHGTRGAPPGVEQDGQRYRREDRDDERPGDHGLLVVCDQERAPRREGAGPGVGDLPRTRRRICSERLIRNLIQRGAELFLQPREAGLFDVQGAPTDPGVKAQGAHGRNQQSGEYEHEDAPCRDRQPERASSTHAERMASARYGAIAGVIRTGKSRHPVSSRGLSFTRRWLSL